MKFDTKKTVLAITAAVCFISAVLMFNYTRVKLKAIEVGISFSNAQLLPLRSDLEKIKAEIPLASISAVETMLSVKKLYRDVPIKGVPAIPRSERIAHAGGALNGETYTNSLEALEANKADFRLFEIDLAFTSDDQLVCSHDWEQYPVRVFGRPLETPPSLAEFVALIDENKRFTNCTIDTLVDWLEKNPEASIITDAKTDNLKALTYISHRFPRHVRRFKPQIYHMDEYEEAKRLGFDDIILTIYRWTAPDSVIVEATRRVKLFAVTVPYTRAPFIARDLKGAGNRIYAHTINSQETLDKLREFGVDEVYTDTLID